MKLLKSLFSLGVAVVLVSCGTAGSTIQASSEEDPEEWNEMAESPLSPRSSAHAFSVGGKLVIMGGSEADPCPPNADCVEPSEPPRSDAAIYDPAADTWTETAEAPMPLGNGSGAVVGDTIYLLLWDYRTVDEILRPAFLSYDLGENIWSEFPLPSDDSYLALTATDAGVVAYQSSQENGVTGDFSFDPATGEWSELPADPLARSFDRSMVWTDAGLVLLGLEDVPQPNGEEPSLYRAALLKGDRWERLTDSEVVGSNPTWSWSGGHLVNSSIDELDGGETNNWGHFYPTGGMFDPAADEWSELPDAPDEPGEFTGISALGERGVVMGNGWIFDADESRWIELPRPADAPETETAAAWVGDELFVWGGVHYEGNEGVLSNEGWSLTLAP